MAALRDAGRGFADRNPWVAPTATIGSSLRD